MYKGLKEVLFIMFAVPSFVVVGTQLGKYFEMDVIKRTNEEAFKAAAKNINGSTSGYICNKIAFKTSRVCSVATLIASGNSGDPRQMSRGVISLSSQLKSNNRETIKEEKCEIPVMQAMVGDKKVWLMFKSFKYPECKLI